MGRDDAAIDAGTVAHIIQASAAGAGVDSRALGGHNLKRGAPSTGHPTRLKQLGCHKTYAVLDVYLELGDPFEGHPLTGGLCPFAPLWLDPSRGA